MTQSRTDKLFKGMSVQTIAMIVTAILEIGMFSFWSRHLTKQDFGYLAAIWGILAMVNSISEAGLGAAIIQKKNASNEYISTAFTLSFILGLVFALLVFFLSPQLSLLVADENLTTPLRLMSILVFTRCLLSVGNSQLIKQLRFARSAIYGILSYLISSVIGIIMALHGFGLYAMILTCLMCPIINIILIYSSSLKLPRFAIKKTEISGIVNYGGWLTLGVIMNTFTQKADSLLLSRLLSVQSLGAYNRPAGFVSTICTKVNSIFDTVLFPLLSQIQNNNVQVQRVLLLSISILNSFSLILAAFFFCNSELIISVFFGQEWVELVQILRIIAFGVIFNVDGQLVDCFFRSLNLVRIGTYIRFFQLILVITAIIIGAKYGIMGVAIALTSAHICIVIIKVLVLSVKVDVSPCQVFNHWAKAWRPIIPIVIISIPYMFIKHTIIINVVYFCIFSTIVVFQFLIRPKCVGREYEEILSPQICKLKSKICSK